AGSQEVVGARDQGSTEAIAGACRCDVERRDLEARLPRRSGGRKNGSGAISARSTDESFQASRRREQVQGGQMQMRPSAPSWGLRATCAWALVCALVLPAAAQPKKGDKTAAPPADKADAKADAKNAANKK